MWLQPARHRRRRRRGLPVIPALIGLVVLAAAAGALYVLHRRHVVDQRRHAAVAQFAAAWSKRDYAAMWTLISAQAKRADSQAQFVASYRDAARQATVTGVSTGPAGKLTGGHARLPVVVHTRLFGDLRGSVSVPVIDEASTARIGWSRQLRLPGLRGEEVVQRQILARPARATVLAATGGRLANEPTAAGIAGTPPGPSSRGSGLEALFEARLGGRPGAELRFGSRLIRKVPIRRARSVRTTIEPRIQRAAAAALGSRLGGIAVVRPRTGDVLALAGLAVSGPQPPGSTFKIITLSAALQAGIATPASSYPVRTFALLSGVRLRNAGDESCGGSLPNAFAVSCNSVFAPLGAKLGARRLFAAAERFGFNEQLGDVPAFKPSTIKRADLRDDLAVGAAAIGQNRDLATPLEMASVGATIGNRGVRARPRLVRGPPVRRRRAVPARVARDVRTMMLGVVRSGTGTAAALPGVPVAGKTGTAELRPTAGGPPDPRNTDAWFVAFAPAERPTVAVAVMLVGAGAGGAAAAPLAREVLAASL
jgi:cell division protein FtsI/penicillin-binding protein 2